MKKQIIHLYLVLITHQPVAVTSLTCNGHLQVRKDFFALLREHSDIDRHSRWSDVKKKIDSDSRYKAVESSNHREDLFREYCKMLKEEKKKAKEKDREHKREKDKEKHKKKDKDKDREHSKDKKGDKEKSKSRNEDEDGDVTMKEVSLF